MRTTPQRGRLRFQFRLRTLLVAVAIGSLFARWFGIELRKARRQREAVKAIEAGGGLVTYWRQSYTAWR